VRRAFFEVMRLRLHLPLLAMAAGALPGPAAAASAAPALQGERLHVAAGAGAVVRDAHAEGRRVLRLTGAGAATGTLRAARPARLVVRAGGEPCAGAPRLVVAVDGARVLRRTVRRRVLTPLTAGGTLAAGRHRISVRLANPHGGGRCTRALRLDRVSFSLSAPSAAGVWRPAPHTTWQWQLDGAIDTSVDAQMFDVDLEDTSASTVAALHAKGARVVCYLSAGSLEDVRPDAAAFPAAVVGKPLDGWPHERWLDVRRLDVLGPIMRRRLDACRAKGFDGVEADNVDAYQNDAGFPLSAADQLRYNRFLAAAAHARGLSIGLKNDLDQVAALEPDFDWALDEECFRYDECGALMPFVRAGKAVFQVEYDVPVEQFCAKANAVGFMSMRKGLDLDAPRSACW
jgi:hypothetical protein